MSESTDRVKEIRARLILDQPFFGVLATRLEVTETTSIKSIATDGVGLYVNPNWLSRVSDAELQGAICHEVLHCSMGHCWRQEWREHKRWNQACDYAINPIVLEAGMVLPKGVLLNPAYAGMASEAVYSELPEPTGGTGGAEKDSASGGSDGQGAGQGEPGNEGPDQDWGEVLQGAPDTASEKQQEWQMATVQALQAAKSQGSLPGSLERMLGEVVRPKISWKDVLRRFVQQTARDDYSWRTPNRRYLALGAYLPSMRSEALPPIVVAVDTSGSIGQAELDEAQSEMRAIMGECHPEKMVVVYCDARVHKVQEFEKDDVVLLKPVGGGGTDFRPPFEWAHKQGLEPACLIYITDMMGTFPDSPPAYPVLWVSTTPGVVAAWGETVSMR